MKTNNFKRGVTIKHARESLGEDYKHLTDEQLQSILDFMYKMAQIEFDQYQRDIEKKNGQLNSGSNS